MRTAAAVPNRVGAVGSFHGGGLVTKNPDSPHLLIPQTKAQYLIAVAENDDMREPDYEDGAQGLVRGREAVGRDRGVPGRARLVPPRHAGLQQGPVREGVGPHARDVREGARVESILAATGTAYAAPAAAIRTEGGLAAPNSCALRAPRPARAPRPGPRAARSRRAHRAPHAPRVPRPGLAPRAPVRAPRPRGPATGGARCRQAAPRASGAGPAELVRDRCLETRRWRRDSRSGTSKLIGRSAILVRTRSRHATSRRGRSVSRAGAAVTAMR